MFNDKFSIGDTILEGKPIPQPTKSEYRKAAMYLLGNLEKDEANTLIEMLGIKEGLEQ